MSRYLVAALLLLATACNNGDQGDPAAARQADDTSTVIASTISPESSDQLRDPAAALEPRDVLDPETLDEPPTVRVAGDEAVLDLRPWTTCWRYYCADGAPLNPEEIAARDAILVEFPVAGWEFSATATNRSDDCGRNQTIQLEPVGPTVHRLTPIGRAGDYEITLTGRGPEGDLFVTFRWETFGDGELPVPEASMSVLADHDGKVDSYGVDATITGLANSPDEVDATVTVTSAEGATHSIVLNALPECTLGAGGIAFKAAISEGLTAASLGNPPFTYDLDLRLDGIAYRGRATWPDDVDPECRPCVPLEFTPPLPAMSTE